MWWHFRKVEEYNVDFNCRRCLEGENGLFQSVLLNEVVIEPMQREVGMFSQVLLSGHNWCGRRCRGGSKRQSEMCLGKVQGVTYLLS